MKKIVSLMIAFLMAFLTVGCSPNNHAADNSNGSVSVDDGVVDEKTSISEAEGSVSAEVEVPEVEAVSHSAALTDEEISALQQMAEEYYETEFPYDLLTIEVLPDEWESYYEDYPEYAVGEILIFRTETTHAGEGTYRTICFAKDSDGWVKINEGY